MYIIIFDDDCLVCNKAVRFIIKKDPQAIFHFTSMHSKTAQRLIKDFNIEQKDRDSIIFVKDERALLRSDAVLEILHTLEGMYSYLYVFRFVPKFIRDTLYDLFAKNRKKLFSGDFCTIDFDKDRVL